jgi:hypothetical protein
VPVDQRIQVRELAFQGELVGCPDVAQAAVGRRRVSEPEPFDVQAFLDPIDRDAGPADNGAQAAKLRRDRDAQIADELFTAVG